MLSVPGATNRSLLTDSAMGHDVCARYDSLRLDVTNSEIPVDKPVCEAKEADRVEMFLSKRVGSDGLNPSSLS